METYSVEILNPKATKLLQDLADLELIRIEPTGSLANVVNDEEETKARAAILRGSPDMNLEAMLEHLRESRQDRKLPFRDE
ncbi:hypothetical protein ACFSUS_27925 [Spirosoma soli]|uniref:Uncharacterized protein n=1 Tax=Spirosoma soli TaxID=1770529 RepID=A0ABW5MD88_9BACT